MSHILTEKALLVRHTVSGMNYGGARKDRAVTEEVAERHNADTKKAGRYSKALIATQFIEKMNKVGSESRGYFASSTLPWDDEGWRILPSGVYLEYMARQRQYRDAYRDAVADFRDQYPEAINEARGRLGTMFKESDYPDVAKLFEVEPTSGHFIRFCIGDPKRGIEVQPIPDRNDFRVSLNSLEMANLQASIEERLQRTLTGAIDDLWARIREPIANLADRLTNYEDAERKLLLPAWVENIRAICELAPKLNLTGDPNLDRICQEAEKALCFLNAEQLKQSKTARALVRDKAAEILDAMSGYCAAA